MIGEIIVHGRVGLFFFFTNHLLDEARLAPISSEATSNFHQHNACEISGVVLHRHHCIPHVPLFSYVVLGHAEPRYFCSCSGVNQQQRCEAKTAQCSFTLLLQC